MAYERAFEFSGPSGKVTLRIQEGGAGRFRIVVSVANKSDEVVMSIPSEQADLITHAIGTAADASGE
jgi:hypothetical protein